MNEYAPALEPAALTVHGLTTDPSLYTAHDSNCPPTAHKS